MINTEKDIKILEESIQEAYRSYDYDLDYSPFSKGIAEVIERVLAERKQDKARIKELEEALLKVKDKNTTLFITCRNSIPKQKVKDEIETLRKMLKATMEGKLQKYTPNEIIIKTNTLEELLEDK